MLVYECVGVGVCACVWLCVGGYKCVCVCVFAQSNNWKNTERGFTRAAKSTHTQLTEFFP